LLRRIKNSDEVQSEKFYNQAFQAHVMGNLEEAISAYRQCLDLDPHHFAALNNLAGACLFTQEYSLARDYLEQALFGTRGISMIYYNLGLIYSLMEQTDKAIESFEKTLSLRPGHFWALINLAEILVDRVQIKDAIEYYRKSVSVAPDPGTVNLRMVELFILENDFSRAEMVLREALAHREMPEYLYNLSWLLLVQKKSIPEAIALLKKARLKKAPYHEALFNQSVAESLNDQYEDSLQHMQNYTNYTTPHDVAALVKNYRTLARVNINNVLASMKIATYLFNEGYEQEAVSELMYLLKRKPDFLPGMKLLADYEYQTGQIEMAIETCHRVLKSAEEENTLESYLLLAKIYGSKGDYDAAMEFVEHALQINPNLPELNYQYATFMAQKGEFQVALKHYKQIAAGNPSYPRIQSRIRMVEEELRESRP